MLLDHQKGQSLRKVNSANIFFKSCSLQKPKYQKEITSLHHNSFKNLKRKDSIITKLKHSDKIKRTAHKNIRDKHSQQLGKDRKSINLCTSKRRTNNILLNILLNNDKHHEKIKEKNQGSFYPTQLTTQQVRLEIQYQGKTLSKSLPIPQEKQYKNNLPMQNFPQTQIMLKIIHIPLFQQQNHINKHIVNKFRHIQGKYLTGFRKTQNLHESANLSAYATSKKQKFSTLMNITPKQNRYNLYQKNIKSTKSSIREAISQKIQQKIPKIRFHRERQHTLQQNTYIDGWSTDLLSKQANFFDINDEYIK